VGPATELSERNATYQFPPPTLTASAIAPGFAVTLAPPTITMDVGLYWMTADPVKISTFPEPCWSEAPKDWIVAEPEICTVVCGTVPRSTVAAEARTAVPPPSSG
jgi:hypothetical protein